MEAEEADVDAVNLLEGVEGALPERERLAHLARVHEPGMNDTVEVSMVDLFCRS